MIVNNENIKIYWNNPACMNRSVMEKIEPVIEYWNENYDLNIQLVKYGLIEEQEMSDILGKDLAADEVNGDIIVSTDMQFFHSQQWLLSKKDDFASLYNQFPLNEEYTAMIHPEGIFHPAVIVPLVIIYNKENTQLDSEFLWSDFLHASYKGKVAIPSTAKPAGKTILKNYWFKYGEDGLKKSEENFVTLSNPAAVFDSVDRGEYPYGIIPLLFASGPGKSGNIKMIIPDEGVMIIISYVAVKKNKLLFAEKFLSETLFSSVLQTIYAERGLMIPVHPEVSTSDRLFSKKVPMIYPDWAWVLANDMEKLNDYID